jgi:small-conductance mechanosensitive channel
VNVVFQHLNEAPIWAIKALHSIAIILAVYLLRILLGGLVKRHISDQLSLYHWRRGIRTVTAVLLIILVGRVWIRGIDSIATFLGLTSAGIAIAMHDTVANIAGYIFILWRKPFKVGDRVQIGETSGDVIDARLFQFSVIEIGNWVDADQSTGRIVHIPNNRVLREPLCNYETGFEYIWHEIPVLITFESNWKAAKEILSTVAREKAEHLSDGAEAQIRRAAMKYLIYFKHLTPIVYTAVKDCGVQLTIRYIVKPRRRRTSEQEVWEAILEAFSEHNDITLAYPTTRFYARNEQSNAPQPH